MAEQTAQQPMAATGQCLCGGVQFRAQLKNREVGACHCGMCRRWSGGTFFAVEFVGDLSFTNEDTLGVYESSEWGERGFCTTCGSSLFWRMRGGGHGVVSPQSLIDFADAQFTGEIFIDEKPAYYNFAEPAHKMTGAEVMAMYAPKPE